MLRWLKMFLKITNIFYDIIARTMVAIFGGVFTKKDDEFYVVTAYPVKNVDKEIKSKEGKRWIRV
jgi:hypothetical protein